MKYTLHYRQATKNAIFLESHHRKTESLEHLAAVILIKELSTLLDTQILELWSRIPTTIQEWILNSAFRNYDTRQAYELIFTLEPRSHA